MDFVLETIKQAVPETTDYFLLVFYNWSWDSFTRRAGLPMSVFLLSEVEGVICQIFKFGKFDDPPPHILCV
jgi:hypothetical protein